MDVSGRGLPRCGRRALLKGTILRKKGEKQMERRIRKVTQETIDAFYPNLNMVAFYRKVAEEFQMPVEE